MILGDWHSGGRDVLVAGSTLSVEQLWPFGHLLLQTFGSQLGPSHMRAQPELLAARGFVLHVSQIKCSVPTAPSE